MSDTYQHTPILRNAVQCNHCQTVVESKSGHDYRVHNCKVKPGLFIMRDGGLNYIRSSVNDPADVTDLSEFGPTETRRWSFLK